MQKIAPIRSLAPFYPEQMHAMGLAFDAAWAILQSKAPVAGNDVEERRAQLGRRIIELAQQGESNPDTLAREAVVRMSARAETRDHSTGSRCGRLAS